MIPNSFLLIPGVGVQGGSLEEVAINGLNETCGLLVNSSRGIIYASNKSDFDQAAGEVSRGLQQRMAIHLSQKELFNVVSQYLQGKKRACKMDYFHSRSRWEQRHLV